MATRRKNVKQNAPRGRSRAAQNRKLRREELLREAGEEFDKNPALQKEFGACSDPRRVWLSYVKFVCQGKTAPRM